MNLNKELEQLVSTQKLQKGFALPLCMDVIAYNAAISDCAKLQRWPLALQHLEALQQRWGEDGR